MEMYIHVNNLKQKIGTASVLPGDIHQAEEAGESMTSCHQESPMWFGIITVVWTYAALLIP